MIVQEVEWGDFKMKFPQGYSVGASANTIDKVDDRKGLNTFKQ